MSIEIIDTKIEAEMTVTDIQTKGTSIGNEIRNIMIRKTNTISINHLGWKVKADKSNNYARMKNSNI